MMEKLLIIILSLLITDHGIAENELHSKNMLGELEIFDINGEDNVESIDMSSWSLSHGRKPVVNVDCFGAVGDGISDDTQAFLKAWNLSCSTPRSVFLVPYGRRYLVNATIFGGPCAGKLTFQIDGAIVAPGEPKNWNPNLPRIWLGFSNLTSALFQGNGIIDGSGSKWWAASCKRNKANPCKKAPTALTIDSSSGIRVRGLTIKNSQQFHFSIFRSDSVRVSNVLISSPGDSPNTDGIHIAESTNVILHNCRIGTGDDCVSIISGSSNIKMSAIYCGPGHGISIGSLGKDNATDFVSKVRLNGAFLKNTTNGLRIKSWQGGSGYVKAVRFENVIMEDVENPIIIDQFYCDSPKPCANLTKAVQVSQIMYQNIIGSTKSKLAMKFSCSDTVPCKDIVLRNIYLQNKNGTAQTSCNAAFGYQFGIIYPPAYCLTCHEKIVTSFALEEDYSTKITEAACRAKRRSHCSY